MSWGAGYEMTGQEPVALAFHDFFYQSGIVGRLTWRGVPIGKSPMDLYLYGEVLHATGVNWLLETGTNFGGSAMFFVDTMNVWLHGYAEVVSIDAFAWPVSDPQYERPRLRGITYVNGDSGAAVTAKRARELADLDRAQKMWLGGQKRMVVLDSIHSQAHVAKELELYADLVTPGCYLVVEDTNLNGHPVAPDHGPGPMEAVAAFLERRKDFVVDERMHRLGMTMAPNGWLRRIA